MNKTFTHLESLTKIPIYLKIKPLAPVHVTNQWKWCVLIFLHNPFNVRRKQSLHYSFPQCVSCIPESLLISLHFVRQLIVTLQISLFSSLPTATTRLPCTQLSVSVGFKRLAPHSFTSLYSIWISGWICATIYSLMELRSLLWVSVVC